MTPWPAVAGGLLGVVVGSYLAVVAIRWERGEAASWGRSRCDTCHRSLSAGELVPIVSYVMVRGRCATCGATIPRRHPAIEVAAALVGGTALGLRPDGLGWAAAAFGWMLVPLAVLDLRCLWLPDRLTLPLLVGGLLVATVQGPPVLIERLAGAAAGFVTFAALRLVHHRLRGREGLGRGDAKLMAAIGAWLGWQSLPWVVVIAAGVGLAWFAWRRRTDPAAFHVRLPLGALLAGAAWLLWLWQAGECGLDTDILGLCPDVAIH